MRHKNACRSVVHPLPFATIRRTDSKVESFSMIERKAGPEERHHYAACFLRTAMSSASADGYTPVAAEMDYARRRVRRH